MGRGLANAPIPVEVIREAFSLRQDGEIIHRETARRDLIGEVAGFMVGNLPVVRIEHEGRTRRIAASRVGWVLATGEWPRGKVALLNGGGYRPSNLSLVPHTPHAKDGKGGRAQALAVRRSTDTALLTALLDRPGAPVSELAEVVGLSKGPVSARLVRLEKAGLAEGPKCCPGKAWALTGKGRELAGGALAPLDPLDKEIMALLARTPLRQVPISRRIGSCIQTARRRLDLLAERGLVEVDAARRYIPTEAGREVLGVEAVPVAQGWLNVSAISAANAKDVTERSSLTDLTREQAARAGGRARFQQQSAAKKAFNPFPVGKPKAKQPQRSFEDYDDGERMAG